MMLFQVSVLQYLCPDTMENSFHVPCYLRRKIIMIRVANERPYLNSLARTKP